MKTTICVYREVLIKDQSHICILDKKECNVNKAACESMIRDWLEYLMETQTTDILFARREFTCRSINGKH